MNLTDRLKNYLQESQETPSDNAVIDGNTGVDYYVTSACIDDASGQQAIKAVRVRPSQQAQLGDEEFLILRDLLVHLIQSKQLHFATLHKSKKIVGAMVRIFSLALPVLYPSIRKKPFPTT
jgi:hypothetical protein